MRTLAMSVDAVFPVALVTGHATILGPGSVVPAAQCLNIAKNYFILS
jgi:hypothetical protein